VGPLAFGLANPAEGGSLRRPIGGEEKRAQQGIIAAPGVFRRAEGRFVTMMQRILGVAIAALMTAVGVDAQGSRPASPRGSAETQVGGAWVKNERGRESYQGGKWIEITYGRPIKRGRTNLFGSGADYGKTLLAGAPVWRAGADVSTRLKTEVPLQIGGKMVPAGEYSLYVDLKENNWTLIVSSWPAQTTYDPKNKAALWGAYNYTPDKDIVRAPMTLGTTQASIDQLTWVFCDVTNDGGKIILAWDTVTATIPFTVAK
jgi:hypothetical protein